MLFLYSFLFRFDLYEFVIVSTRIMMKVVEVVSVVSHQTIFHFNFQTVTQQYNETRSSFVNLRVRFYFDWLSWQIYCLKIHISEAATMMEIQKKSVFKGEQQKGSTLRLVTVLLNFNGN